MVTETIREMLEREPFAPFRILSSCGEAFIVRDPHTVALLKSEVFIAQPNSDRRTFLPLMHVAAVETLGAHRNGGSRRRKRS
jgi:hypothetical protein